ncbi:hypothetical protein CP356_00915 [Lactobacillus sp. UMNPBX5]|nr:hypothetical protein CP356_00915 [Lactobacillus sp. UMNPBX5]
MTEYKEIQEQTYLNLDSGNVYFAIEEVLRIINTQTEANQANSIPPTKLKKIMKTSNINWLTLDRSQIKLIINYHAPTPDDEHTASKNKIDVIGSTDMVKLIKTVRLMNPSKKAEKNNLPYIEESWGLIEKNDPKDALPPLYYSITRTTYEIQGHQADGHVSAPNTDINPKTLIKKAKDFAKANPQKFELIKVKPSDIFSNSKINVNSVESYVNLELHDELLNHYKTRKGIHLKKEMASLDGMISSKEPVIKYIRKNLPNAIQGNSDAFEVKLTDDDVRAIDKSITRQYDNVEAYARSRFNEYEDKVNKLRNSNIKYAIMREKLKNYLNYEYDKAEVIKLFANKTAHHIIDSKLRNMFDL